VEKRASTIHRGGAGGQKKATFFKRNEGEGVLPSCKQGGRREKAQLSESWKDPLCVGKGGEKKVGSD